MKNKTEFAPVIFFDVCICLNFNNIYEFSKIYYITRKTGVTFSVNAELEYCPIFRDKTSTIFQHTNRFSCLDSCVEIRKL